MERVLEFSSDDVVEMLEKTDAQELKRVLILSLKKEKKVMEKTGISGWYRAIIAVLRTAFDELKKEN